MSERLQRLETLAFPPDHGGDPSSSLRSVGASWTELDETRLEAGGAGLRPISPKSLPQLQIGESGAHELQLELLHELGRGGMGKVTLAIQRSLQREVAVKTARDARPGTVAALLREAVYAGHLEHPNVVPVHELGRDENELPLMVMKRVDGDPWSDLLADPEHPRWRLLGPDRLRATLDVLRQVCNAVHFAQSRGIVHRDIKPANVMIGDFGDVYLLDWGLALQLHERDPECTDVVGTPAYMAPEMIEGEGSVDGRTDVYLLGATLHQALTGRPRHDSRTPMGALAQAIRSDPVVYGPEVPAELGELCNRAMALDPEQRPPSAQAFREALEAFLSHRAALQLSQEASALLAELRTQVAAPDPDRAQLATIFAACRFGFRQALREWPESPGAREGLQASLELMVGHELGQGNLDRAQDWLAELPSPRPDLSARADELRAAHEEEQARLHHLELEQDLSVSRAQRSAFLVAGGLFATLVLVMASAVALGGLVFTQTTGVGFSLAVLLFLGVGVFVGRGALLRTAINRRQVATACTLATVPLLAQVQGILAGTSVELTALTILLALGASFLAAGSALGSRELAITGAALVLGAFASGRVLASSPNDLLPVLGGSFLTGFALLAAFGWRARRQA